jgi:hypothetical protein
MDDSLTEARIMTAFPFVFYDTKEMIARQKRVRWPLCIA